MNFDEEARLVRLEADHEAINGLLDAYPWGAAVGPREPGCITASLLDLARLSADPAKRAKMLLEKLSSYEASLVRSVDKHDSLKRNGLSEICDSDLMICYSGDPLAACMHTMRLHEAHISYDRSVLEILDQELAKLDSNVPQGFVQIDVLLPDFQAFQVKKWANVAEPLIQQARKEARLNTRREQRTRHD
ncbi:hypothetical protein [Pseudomonas syringae]|uniref:hypothetical protein n=1 Tax=Pseudomonas syringae TaxID=317 RepID=UPI0002098DF2|nr:hypothetical protein [Pseudomonas syringae]MDP5168578.1 hypothetical protein [Pseudomonas syringae pv. aptata str. DSM 50252]